MKHVQSKKLVELYACENKIAEIDNIKHLTSLTILELGSNRIKVSSWIYWGCPTDGLVALHAQCESRSHCTGDRESGALGEA